jgi:hypothetical protein
MTIRFGLYTRWCTVSLSLHVLLQPPYRMIRVLLLRVYYHSRKTVVNPTWTDSDPYNALVKSTHILLRYHYTGFYIARRGCEVRARRARERERVSTPQTQPPRTHDRHDYFCCSRSGELLNVGAHVSTRLDTHLFSVVPTP